MKCQNCGENEVNFKFTQVINGVKKEYNLCDKCAKELGLDDIDFNMPSFSDLWDDMFDMYNSLIPTMSFINDAHMLNEHNNEVKIKKQENNIITKQRSSVREDIEAIRNKKNKKESTQETKLQMLQKKLEKEIKEERYEDAAKTRDEIKKLK